MTEEGFPPGVVAAAVAAARALLRMPNAAEAAVIDAAAASALGLAEQFVGQRLVVRGFTDAVPADGRWHRLAAEPVTAIATAGVAVDIAPDGVGWVRADGGGAVAVAYTAGLATTWEALPPGLAQGVALLAAHLFEHREGDRAPPVAVAALWRPWRRMRIGAAVREARA